MFGFDKVVAGLKEGKFFSREGWKNGIFIGLQKPDENSKMTLPYIYMVVPEYNPDGSQGRINVFPENPSSQSLLAEDWFETDAQGSRAIAN